MAASLIQTIDEGGNDLVLNSVTLGATGPNQGTGVSTGCTIFSGTGAPSFTAGQGDLYLRTDGSSTSTRAYINTTGSTTWTSITTAG